MSKPEPLGVPEDYQFEHGVPDTAMTRRFGHLRETAVKTVAETVSDFYEYVSIIGISAPLFLSSSENFCRCGPH